MSTLPGAAAPLAAPPTWIKTKSYFRDHEKVRNSLAGAAAGASASFLTCPLDVVKTRLQFSAVPIYRGTFDGLVTIARTEGYRGWYRGLSATMLGYLPSWAIYFMVYEESKQFFHRLVPPPPSADEDPRHNVGFAPAPLGAVGLLTPNVINVLSAMSAGIASTTATNPLWVVKSRFMTQSETTSYRYSSVRDAFRQIFVQEGVRGFYKGLGTSLLGVSHAAVQFPLYEKFKTILHHGTWMSPFTEHPPDLHHRTAIASHHILAASVMSKMIASMITYPHEVVRTRLQNQTQPIKYHGIRHCVQVIAKEEGLRAFYRGLSTNLFRTLPSSAITLFTYERLAKWLSDWSHSS
ncbi:mitochondrial carrier domain-containing protein [Catenaria anguillulae PL171]|uniref:Mitochondrial carrier domain-containing protein n=1 Tax=Catenaria anguillulae PL171 TaxID=765915 RepID=A0A1Y2I1Y8_9FUNG|nr:mitochondrial carrier domain-containing protein [Catenaria anguillulae PL171]